MTENDDLYLTQLQETGRCTLWIEFNSHTPAHLAVHAARQRAYRLAETLAVKVSTAVGWHVLYVTVVG
jgi:hypothetical protein